MKWFCPPQARFFLEFRSLFLLLWKQKPLTILTRNYSYRREKRARDFSNTILIFGYSYIYDMTILTVLQFLFSWISKPATILTQHYSTGRAKKTPRNIDIILLFWTIVSILLRVLAKGGVNSSISLVVAKNDIYGVCMTSLGFRMIRFESGPPQRQDMLGFV